MRSPIAALLLGLVTSQAGAAAPPRAASVAGLKILITNDDSVQAAMPNGSDGRGLYELRRTLCAAGADVLVVGPWGQQSGAGGKTTVDSTAAMTVQPVTPPSSYADDCAGAPSGGRVYGVCVSHSACTASSPTATPADTVQVALRNFVRPNFWADGPDLVLTGINFGENTGIGVFHSGTTSAAVTASQEGVPSIAFSEALSSDPAQIYACYLAGQGCPTYTAAADFAVRLIGTLRRQSMLQPSLLLNVNYPHLAPGQQPGEAEINVLGYGESLTTGWSGSVGRDGGTYSFGIGTPRPETRDNADNTALANRRISIVPMTGDWSTTHSSRLAAVVNALD